MHNEAAGPILANLGQRWWAAVLRGIVAIIFGIIALARPGLALAVLITVWGVYAIADGVFNFILAARSGRAGGRWGWFLFEGLVSIAAGVVTFAWPGLTALVLLYVIAAWAIVTGISEIAAAIRLRHFIRNEFLLGLAGALSVAFGIILFSRPGAGAIALLWLIGVYAVAFGLLLIGLGIRMYRWSHPRERAVPPGGVPTPA